MLHDNTQYKGPVAGGLIYQYTDFKKPIYHKILSDIQYTNFKDTIHWQTYCNFSSGNILIYTFYGVEYNIQISNDQYTSFLGNIQCTDLGVTGP